MIELLKERNQQIEELQDRVQELEHMSIVTGAIPFDKEQSQMLQLMKQKISDLEKQVNGNSGNS